VLVLQVDGEKAWRVDGLGDLVLEAGDVLYLPRGTRHAAQSQRSSSLHLTIGLVAVTYRQVLRRALDAVDGDLDLPLPLGYAHPERVEDLQKGIAAAIGDAAAALAGTDAGGRAAIEVERARRRRKPSWEGQLRSVLAAHDLDDRTVLRRRPDNPALLADEPAADGRLVLELVDRRLLLPPITRDALEAVLTRATIRVGELVGIDESSRQVLARRLVKEGLLVVES
jgi:bifunctional lysine-specific demethylase and histidyl-hydroxylase NO66